MTRDIDSPDYRDSNVGEGMIPPRKSPNAKPRAGEHTVETDACLRGSGREGQLIELARKLGAERDALVDALELIAGGADGPRTARAALGKVRNGR